MEKFDATGVSSVFAIIKKRNIVCLSGAVVLVRILFRSLSRNGRPASTICNGNVSANELSVRLFQSFRALRFLIDMAAFHKADHVSDLKVASNQQNRHTEQRPVPDCLVERNG
jgi:hypothetical protein